MADDVFLKQVYSIVGDKELAKQVLDLLEREEKKEKERRHRIQMEGIKNAKKRGVALGRPVKSLPENFGEIYEKFCLGEVKAKEGADLCQMGISTFYRKMKEYEISLDNPKNQSLPNTGKEKE